MQIVFIYQKGNVTRVLSSGMEDTQQRSEQLLKNGFIHTTTLDARVFIEYICNLKEEVDVYSEVQELKRKTNN